MVPMATNILGQHFTRFNSLEKRKRLQAVATDTNFIFAEAIRSLYVKNISIKEARPSSLSFIHYSHHSLLDTSRRPMPTGKSLCHPVAVASPILCFLWLSVNYLHMSDLLKFLKIIYMRKKIKFTVRWLRYLFRELFLRENKFAHKFVPYLHTKSWQESFSFVLMKCGGKKRRLLFKFSLRTRNCSLKFEWEDTNYGYNTVLLHFDSYM